MDLVVEGTWTAAEPGSSISNGSPKATETFCADETFLGLPLESDRPLETTLDVGADAVLEVVGCLLAADETGTSEGWLDLFVEAASGEPERLRIPLVSNTFWQKTLDLRAFAQDRATLRLHTKVSNGVLWIRELRVAAETRSQLASPRERPLHVLYISVDTLREDGLREDDSHLASFLEDAKVFRPHYASAGWTRPSHGTLLTGLSPLACGAMGDKGSLRPGLRTLVERFREAGFRTSALVYDVEWFHPRFGFDRGFEQYRVRRWRLDRAAREVARWISEHRDEPFLFFFHTFEPHSDARWLPYESSGTTRESVRDLFGVSGYGCRSGLCASSLLVALDQRKVEPLPREPEILQFLYRRSAEFVDRELDALFEDLRRMGLYDSMLIVVTSDHGEVLLEHGQLLHGKPWEEVIRVPLAIKWPGGHEVEPATTNLATSSHDLVPTLLEAASLDVSDLPGMSLSKRRREEPIFVGHNFRAVIDRGLKAVFRDPEPPLLFDLTVDPGETVNLASERPEDLDRLHRLVVARWEREKKLAAHFDRPTPGRPEPELTPEERRRLRSLGYLDGDG